MSVRRFRIHGKEGYVEGISKVLIDSLSDMEVTNRPIHCTDSKRKSLYIKNNNEWHKDNNNVEMKKGYYSCST